MYVCVCVCMYTYESHDTKELRQKINYYYIRTDTYTHTNEKMNNFLLLFLVWFGNKSKNNKLCIEMKNFSSPVTFSGRTYIHIVT